MRTPPRIPPRPAGATTPRWSVMIPTYEPCDYLKTALESVLAQDPGRDAMQIAVVDDASPRVDVERLVRAIAGDRVEVFPHTANAGLAGNWNRCLNASRGDLVHLLHQDDRIRPEFYDALEPAFDLEPPAGAAFCRTEFIDEQGQSLSRYRREQPHPGILPRWLPRIAAKQRIFCSAFVARRAVYETLGGFVDDLPFALDWEMWTRIASRFPVWYVPDALNGFRIHAGSETGRLLRSSRTVWDLARCVDRLQHYLPPRQRDDVWRRGQRFCATEGLNSSLLLLQRKQIGPALQAFAAAMSLDPIQGFTRCLSYAAKWPARALRRSPTGNRQAP